MAVPPYNLLVVTKLSPGCMRLLNARSCAEWPLEVVKAAIPPSKAASLASKASHVGFPIRL